MVRLVTLIIMFVAGISFQAEAIVKQKASNALSYRNVVSGSSVTNSGIGLADILPEEIFEEKSEIKEINLQSGFSKSVKVSEGEEFYVLLNDDSEGIWNISYDEDNIIMTANSVDGNIRKVQFTQRGNGDSSIYFDKLSSNGEITQNKAVYVKVN